MARWCVLGMVGVLLTSACGDEGPEVSPLVGTWNLTSTSIDGVATNPDDLFGIPVRITFSANGTGSADVESLGQPDGTDALTWSTNGATLLLQLGGVETVTMTWAVSGNTLTVSGVDPDNGEVWLLVFTRQ